ncbi:hypothetical protein [Corynebacterium urogenitale]|uniref:hypothetical protein n=1 Tax=Corynebacterium urogenitale TaxID=2487892 RepID=UPI00125EE937|nr:hypothetical protein [Corynebacterium urogenitale]
MIKSVSAGLGLWATGLLGLITSIAGITAWLSWTAADHSGHFRGPGWPVPTSFPAWQIACCGATLLLLFIFTVSRSSHPFLGVLSAACGSAHGLTTAMALVSADGINPQAGIGVAIVAVASTGAYAALCPAIAAWRLGRFQLP